MRIGYIARTFEGVKSTDAFRRLVAKTKDELIHIEPNMARLGLIKGKYVVKAEEVDFSDMDVFFPRVWEGDNLDYCLVLLRHLERMGKPVLNSSSFISLCRNKYASLQELQKYHIPIPKSVLSLNVESAMKSARNMKKPYYLEGYWRLAG